MRIGIDVGTHSARAAALDAAGRPYLIPDAYGATHLPAVVRYGPRGLAVGEGPARTLVAGWECSVRGPSRYLARYADLPPAAHSLAPFPILDVGGEPCLDLLYARAAPAEALGAIIEALCRRAAAHLGAAPTGAVIAVPASADDRYRLLVRRAAEAQGLTVLRLINQPAAALLALAHASNAAPRQGASAQPPQGVAIVDIGGGTTEVSIAERAGDTVRILATVGDPFLGGHDLAWRVAGGLAATLAPQAGRDLLADQGSKVAALGLLAAAEAALEDLALRPATTVAIDHGAGFGRDLYTVLRRPQAEAWLADELARIGALCARALAMAGRAPAAIAEVVLVGGGGGLPGVQSAVARAFARLPGDVGRPAPLALAAFGAALAATPAGAALRDVATYPLGINCYFGDTELLSPIIPAGAPIPTPPPGAPGARTERYTTLRPDQTSVRLDVLQYRGPKTPGPTGPGRVRPGECEVLGTWEFAGLRPPPGGHADFTVTFTVDGDGILHLAAEETATGHTLAGTVRRML